MEWAAAFSAITVFSAGGTHTVTGVDSRRVFFFFWVVHFPSGSRAPLEEQDWLLHAPCE
jgi:hypothetical protein